MESAGQQSLEHGDRVTAARDLDTQGFTFPGGAQGTVAEDRGSKLVVAFDDEESVVSLTEPDLVRLNS